MDSLRLSIIFITIILAIGALIGWSIANFISG